MKEILLKRIEELGQEAAGLMQRRSHMEDQIKQIEARLHQISGAISELDAMSRRSTGETSKTNGRQPAQGASETSGPTATSEDSLQAQGPE